MSRCRQLLVACALAATSVNCVGLGLPPSYVAQAGMPSPLGHLQPVVQAAQTGAAQAITGVAGTNLQLAPAVVFQDGTGTLSYHAPTYADLPPRTEIRDVQGRACESGLQVPWGTLTWPNAQAVRLIYASAGWGDSGYQRALRDAASQVAPDAVLYDVRADLQTINVLSIWRQSCLVVTASVVTRLPEQAEAEGASAGAGGGAGVSRAGEPIAPAKPASDPAQPAAGAPSGTPASAPTKPTKPTKPAGPPPAR